MKLAEKTEPLVLLPDRLGNGTWDAGRGTD